MASGNVLKVPGLGEKLILIKMNEWGSMLYNIILYKPAITTI